jgi:tRNA (adenine57-N1/adenine58-N1)-methyltransferase catalytic subunit
MTVWVAQKDPSLHHARRAWGHEPFYLKRLLHRLLARSARPNLPGGVNTDFRLAPGISEVDERVEDKADEDGPGAMSAEGPLVDGEPVLVRRREGEAYLLPLRATPQSVEGVGVIDLSGQIGAAPGGMIEWAGVTYRVLRPSLADILRQLRRRAQIITPKDAQQLLYLAQVRPGGHVAEAGAGSGALTIVLAYAVGSEGRVTSYERRADFLEVARRNVAQAGFSNRVRFVERDVAVDGFDESALDGIVLDVPEPWGVLEAARSALAIGGAVATYTPTYNQLERTVRALRALGFEEVRSLELLERALHVGEGGTRPEFDMLGHTAFLTGARRVS